MIRIVTALVLATLSFSLSATESLLNRLNTLGLTGTEIKDSPLPNMKTVLADQGVFYISQDGNYIIQGHLYQLTANRPVNLTTKMLFNELNSDEFQKEMIVYPAQNEKYKITVFMDISCHYCRLLHQQIKDYNALGITVRYLAFPRNGKDSETAAVMEAIWASSDPQTAFNDAERGNLPKNRLTPNKVKRHYLLGSQFGIQGTPAILTDNGQLLEGYVRPQDLLSLLQVRTAD